MGFISNQWLNRGHGLRDRGYRPVPVAVSCGAASGSWSQHNQVPIEFIARQSNGEYQTLYLTQAEAEDAVKQLLSCISVRSREAVLVGLMRELTHAKLLKALALDLNERVRLSKNC